jgi:hypothetical protein
MAGGKLELAGSVTLTPPIAGRAAGGGAAAGAGGGARPRLSQALLRGAAPALAALDVLRGLPVSHIKLSGLDLDMQEVRSAIGSYKRCLGGFLLLVWRREMPIMLQAMDTVGTLHATLHSCLPLHSAHMLCLTTRLPLWAAHWEVR